ncbi:hypothetical protein H2199_006181 [Coniosporium tulheliwenetii]|uniref:Uncharacterized protein n=1 Tax=Coniosporium tulheliwenetii TaxID=3383036 RepID=A0ACC2YX76_9PEZI|nr:hypothetical protein H2199_006181 [Cladosporium sp. JES 115]
MRLTTDSSNPSRSPSQTFSNGSSNGVSPARRKAAANGSSHSKTESNGSYANGNAVRAPQRPWFGHDREEVTRILIQSLTELGYHGAAGALCQESGYELEGPTVAAFRSAVLLGDWAEAEALLFGVESYDDGGGVGLGDGDTGIGNGKAAMRPSKSSWQLQGPAGGLTLAEGANKSEMMFWMRQQKYLELLEQRDLGAALMVLRQELTPLHQDTGRLHALSSLMMCQSAEDLKYQAQWDGAAGESRSYLLINIAERDDTRAPARSALEPGEGELDIELPLPQHLSIALLYVDHSCDREDFPLKTVLELRNHHDEVWFLRFSHDGSMLATASKDCTVVIYDTTTFKPLHILADHDAGVCYVAWSPDDTKLISCAQAQDNCARVWDTKTGKCIITLNHFTYPVTCAAWSPNSDAFILGSQDTGAALCIHDLNGTQLYAFSASETFRVHDIAISPDGTRLIALLETRIVVYDYQTREKLGDWEMENAKTLTSLCVSGDGRRMLVSTNENCIRLLSVETGECLQTFEGQRQSEFIIRSSFGGAGEGFVVSGSEDSRVYIWRTNGHLVEALDAHRPGCVNAVAWHPTNPSMFASAGDDCRIRM